MNDSTVPNLDPDRLKAERDDVDLGADAETGHDHASHGAGGEVADPAIGATPPAR